MRALASKGGVVQVTMYSGFLCKEGDATLDDFLRHLQHAIDVAGIDHVGIGTDFDGDGKVQGCSSASQLRNITRELLRRGYSHADIEKIWGNVDKANQVLGWKAEANLDDVLATAWKWQVKLREDGIM
jgi:microsomal dipeptidase-like Zn-dependent dipeptidase